MSNYKRACPLKFALFCKSIIYDKWVCSRPIAKKLFSQSCKRGDMYLANMKTESTRSSRNNKWTKSLFEGYLNIFSTKIISNNTKDWKQTLNFVRNTWTYWWNKTDDEISPVVCNISLNFEIYFFAFSWEIANIYLCLALRNVKRTGTWFLSTKNWNCSIFYQVPSNFFFDK